MMFDFSINRQFIFVKISCVKNSWKEWFYCTRAERNGTIVLAVIMLVVLIVYALLPGNASWEQEKILKDEVQWKSKEDSSLAVVSSGHEDELAVSHYPNQHEQGETALFEFDPNHLPVEQWLLLGLTERQVKMIHNFEAKGGHFYKKSDLAKIYCITPEIFDRLSPYILLPESFGHSHSPSHTDTVPLSHTPTQTHTHTPTQSSSNSRSSFHEINSADTLSLRKIPGIGPFFARQIIKYREQLGGFNSYHQLNEVWKMRPGLADTISNYISINQDLIRKINVNKDSEDVLVHHPYITAGQGRCIVAYREKHGPYLKWEELIKAAVFDETTFQKIKPYLSLE